MKFEIEVSDDDVVATLDEIMSNYPNSETDANLICIKAPSDESDLTYEFFDRQTNQRFTLIKDSLIVALGKCMEPMWTDTGLDTPDLSDLVNWAANITTEECDAFIQLACYGEIKYPS